MREVILYVATSIDGCIAGPNDELDWLPQEGGEDCGYSSLMDQVDTIVMGSRTWEVTSKLSDWLWGDRRGIVFSGRQLAPSDHVSYVSSDAGDYVQQLKELPGKNIWLLGGGQLTRTLMDRGLVDRLILTVLPTVLGEGLPLFPGGFCRSDWSLDGVQGYTSGMVQLSYSSLK